MIRAFRNEIMNYITAMDMANGEQNHLTQKYYKDLIPIQSKNNSNTAGVKIDVIKSGTILLFLKKKKNDL